MVPGDEGVAALDATAQAITATMEALQAEQPRITPQEALVQRLQALAGELPEARWPMVGLEDEDEEGIALAPDVGRASEAEAPLAGLDTLDETSMASASMWRPISLPSRSRLPKMRWNRFQLQPTGNRWTSRPTAAWTWAS